MNPFSFRHLEPGTTRPPRTDGGEETFIAGGTDLLQLMREGVAAPDHLVDIRGALGTGVSDTLDGLRIGAATRLADAADDETLRRRLPLVAEALAETASPQVRNMATVGGNLLQRTRCLYFRDVSTPCNKRTPGSGCPAMDGCNRINAVFGGSDRCIAVSPSDLAVALVALDAEVTVAASDGRTTLKVEDLYRLPGDMPELDTVLRPGDLITEVFVPAEAAALAQRYVKVRDRGSFEWALVSVAVALAVVEGRIEAVRLAAGGVATKPWRLRQVETDLVGRPFAPDVVRAAAARATEGAEPRPGNAFKVPMLEAAVTRTLLSFGGWA